MSEGTALTRVLSAVEIVEKPQIIIPVRLHTYSMDVESGAKAVSLLAYALVDTGASKTCICPKLLDQLHCERYQLRNLAGSTGQQQVYQRFASLEMLDGDKVTFARFDDVEVIEFQSRDQDTYKVLLGMDLLGRFDLIQIRGFEISFGTPQV
jgi:gag-polyprotein putative aspartyl protease